MAHSKNFFGLRKGSTKSLTFQTLHGMQITKDRVTDVANPQSAAQMAQRLKMPLVASARSVLKTLVNHSFEGVTYGEESLREFSRLNMSKDALTIKQYVPKGAMDTGLANFIISRGSLPIQSVTFAKAGASDGLAGEMHLATGFVSSEKTISSVEDFINVLISLGYNEGDQLTFLVCYQGDKYEYNSTSGETLDAYYHRFVVSRFVLDAENEATKGWTFDTNSLSDGFIKLTPNFVTGGGESYVKVQPESNFGGFKILGGCVILSRLNDTTWQRSSQRLSIYGDAFDSPEYSEVIGGYLKPEASSTKYLNSGVDGVDITGGNA